MKVLSHDLDLARRKWEEKRDFIKSAMEQGAEIEPGYLTASLQDINPSPYSASPKPYKKLIVR